MLDDDDHFATVVQTQRSGRNLDACGAVAGADSAGHLIQDEHAPDLTATWIGACARPVISGPT